jgi:hypothetical protein
MKKLILKTALLACAAIAGSAQALSVADQGTWETTLLGRDINGAAVTARDANGVLDNSAVFLYDDVLKITWLRYVYGNPRDWSQAVTWAADLEVGAYGGWRLPAMIATPNASYRNDGGTDNGYNVRTKSGIATQYQAGQTVYSEMAHLWYSTLGNLAYCTPGDIFCDPAQSGWGMSNNGDFQNLGPDMFWSGLAYDSDTAWRFDAESGRQGFYSKVEQFEEKPYAMAVLDGDVLISPIPEPETYALMLAGLAVVGAAARRRKAK